MTKRIDEVGPIGNIRSTLAGAKGAVKGAFNSSNPFSGAIQGAKNAYADKNGAIAVKQWANKIRNEWSRQANVYGNTEDGFKAFVRDYLRLPDFAVPPRPAAGQATPPSSGNSPSSANPASAPQSQAPAGNPKASSLGSSNPMYNTTVSAKPTPRQPAPPRPTASFASQQSNYNVNVKAAPPPAPAAAPAPAAPAAPASALNPANIKPASPEGNAPTPSAAATPAAQTHAELAASLAKQYGFSKNDANEAVNAAVAKLGPTASESAITREAIRSMRRPSSDDRDYRPATESISPSLGRIGDRSFSHLFEEGFLEEDDQSDWLDAICMDAARQFLQKNPITFQASCKYKLGTTQYRDYLNELRAQHGINRPTAPAGQVPPSRQSTASPTAPTQQSAASPAPTQQSAASPAPTPQAASPAAPVDTLGAALSKMGRIGQLVRSSLEDDTIKNGDGKKIVDDLARRAGRTPEEIASFLADILILLKKAK